MSEKPPFWETMKKKKELKQKEDERINAFVVTDSINQRKKGYKNSRQMAT